MPSTPVQAHRGTTGSAGPATQPAPEIDDPDDAAPDPDDAAPDPDDAAPDTDGAAPDTDVAAPDTDDVAPHPDDVEEPVPAVVDEGPSTAGPDQLGSGQDVPGDVGVPHEPAGHLVLAGAAPHEVRPASDAPPSGRPAGAPSAARATGAPSAARATARWAEGRAVPPEDADDAGPAPHASVRGRRGADTAPQPVPEPDPRAGLAPRGAVAVLAVLVVLAVLAAVGVLLVGPDQVDAAFAGLGAGTGVLPRALWGVSW
jgi:hypothetical protein